MDHPAGIRGGEIAIEESEAGGEAAFDAEVTFHAEFGELGADGAVDEPASSGAVGEGAEDEEDESGDEESAFPASLPRWRGRIGGGG